MIEKVEKIENNKILSPEIVEKELKSNPFGNFLVYKKDNIIIGYLYYSLIYDRIEINQIEVLKEERRKKIGSNLLQYLIDNNKNNITLEVKIDNYPAINLYKKYGFKEVAIRKGYYEGIDGILMERKIGD
ncbi:MAG: GNAT family N-acetyltransferase [Bacilli bacterium]|nr:GNAT family N-acetyltransferase [Bacilli bacterium]